MANAPFLSAAQPYRRFLLNQTKFETQGEDGAIALLLQVMDKYVDAEDFNPATETAQAYTLRKIREAVAAGDGHQYDLYLRMRDHWHKNLVAAYA
jgi:hypothetical protein